MAGPFDAGTVSARLVLNLDEWSANLEKAKADSGNLAGAVGKHSEEIEKLGKTFAVVGGAIVVALGAAIKKTADYGDELFKTSQKTGIATETLSGYKLAADKADLSLASLAAGLAKMTRNIGDAIGGNEEMQKTLERVGLKATDTTGKMRPMDDLLGDVAQKFSQMPDGVEKSQLAMDLFGKSGAAMIPLLNSGRDGLKAEREEAERLGLIMGTQAAEQGGIFNDQMTTLNKSLQGIVIVIGQALIPVVTKISEGFTWVVVSVRKVAEIFPPLTGFITAAVGAFGGLLALLGPTLIILPKLISSWAIMSTTISTVGTAIAGLSAKMSLSIPIYGAIVVAILAVNAAANAYAASQETQMAEIVKGGEKQSQTWKWLGEQIHGIGAKNSEAFKKWIAEMSGWGWSSEKIADAVYATYGKVIERTKQIAVDTAAMAGKVMDIQKELTDKLKEFTSNEFDFKIYKAKQYYDDLRTKIKGSVDEAKLAAQIDKAQAAEVAKIKSEQAEFWVASNKKAADAVVKRIADVAATVKKHFDGMGKAVFNWAAAVPPITLTLTEQMALHFNKWEVGFGKNIDNAKKKFLGFTVSSAKDFGSFVQVMQDGINNFFGNFSRMADANLAANLERLNTEYEARKKWIMTNITDVTQRDKMLADLDADTAKKKRQLEHDAAKKKRDLDIFQAVTNMGVAITASWKLGWPLGMFAAAFALTACMMQINAIKKVPLPAMAEGGLIERPTTVLAGEAGPEAILPMRELKRMLGIGRGNMGSTKTVQVNVSAIDAYGFDRIINEKLIPKLTRALNNESFTIPVKAVR